MITALPDGRIFAGWADTWVTLNNKWRKLLWKAEVPVKGMHAARHTFGTTMLRTGVDIATVRDLLGHQSIKTTATYLAGVEADKVRVFLTAIPSGVENQIRPA
jgi:integrase